MVSLKMVSIQKKPDFSKACRAQMLENHTKEICVGKELFWFEDCIGVCYCMRVSLSDVVIAIDYN